MQALEAERTRGNLNFTIREAQRVQQATKDPTGKPLTAEQAQTIATDEDTTLVLAGAGTGKTSVITGKITHLVRNQGVAPESILALAFIADAAKEVMERLSEDLKQTQVSTFHSFALRVVGKATGEAPTVSTLATDDVVYQKVIDDMLSHMLTSREFANDVISLVTSE